MPRAKLIDFNERLTCKLCSGYLIDPATIVICLHSFCRSCLVKHLQQNHEVRCPVCEEQLQHDNPFQDISSDEILQTLVYKIVPGLFKKEVERRQQFLKEHSDSSREPLEQILELRKRFLCSDDLIDVCIDYLPDDASSSCQTQQQQSQEEQSQTSSSSTPTEDNSLKRSIARCPQRYLRCDASTKIVHLKKWLRLKYDLKKSQKIDVFSNQDPLLDHWTLLDLFYIYGLKDNLLFLHYQVMDGPNLLGKFRGMKRKKVKGKKINGKKFKLASLQKAAQEYAAQCGITITTTNTATSNGMNRKVIKTTKTTASPLLLNGNHNHQRQNNNHHLNHLNNQSNQIPLPDRIPINGS